MAPVERLDPQELILSTPELIAGLPVQHYVRPFLEWQRRCTSTTRPALPTLLAILETRAAHAARTLWRRFTLALLAVMLLATPAHAVLVSYSFDVRQSTGPFNEVEDTLFGYGPTVTDILHVTLLYNSDASDQPWPFPNRALYPLAHTAIIGSIGLNVFAGVRTDDFSCCPFAFPSGDVEVGDGPPPSTDILFPAGADAWAGGMTITSGLVIAGLSGLAAPLVEAVRASDGSGFGVHLMDLDGTALSSTSLPVRFPTTGWDVGRFSIALIACIDDSDCYASAFRFSGDIDVNSLRSHVIGVPARVPSPSTLALLAGGLLSLTAFQGSPTPRIAESPWSRLDPGRTPKVRAR